MLLDISCADGVGCACIAPCVARAGHFFSVPSHEKVPLVLSQLTARYLPPLFPYTHTVAAKGEQWLCAPCSSRVPNVSCVLCPRKGGAFLRIKANHYCHAFCAERTPGARIVDPLPPPPPAPLLDEPPDGICGPLLKLEEGGAVAAAAGGGHEEDGASFGAAGGTGVIFPRTSVSGKGKAGKSKGGKGKASKKPAAATVAAAALAAATAAAAAAAGAGAGAGTGAGSAGGMAVDRAEKEKDEEEDEEEDEDEEDGDGSRSRRGRSGSVASGKKRLSSSAAAGRSGAFGAAYCVKTADIKGVPKDIKKASKCHICKRKYGAMVACAHTRSPCDHWMHPMCAAHVGRHCRVLSPEEAKKTPFNSKYAITCQDHTAVCLRQLSRYVALFVSRTT